MTQKPRIDFTVFVEIEDNSLQTPIVPRRS